MHAVNYEVDLGVFVADMSDIIMDSKISIHVPLRKAYTA